MERTRLQDLVAWLNLGAQEGISHSRKPLVIRGARQVGKTWLVRHLANICDLDLIELNFERQPKLISLFNSNDPKKILLNLESVFSKSIDLKKTLLFIDEVQAAPEFLSQLRWFAEELPELPVIVAGSLLEFVLGDHEFSMPVGRISYLYLEPLSFEEFLLAREKGALVQLLKSYQWGDEIPEIIHESLMALLKEYMVVGGLPAAVLNWTQKQSLTEVSRIHHDLLSTYRDDFAKYRSKLSIERLSEVVDSIPRFLGEKWVYRRVNSEVSTGALKQAFSLLQKARLCHSVTSTAANGLPLSAELNEKYMRAIFLDVGMVSAALGLSFHSLESIKEIALVNNGGVAEQLVGQLLRTLFPSYVEPSLYYWLREEKSSNAELDYIISHGAEVVPIEVKAGSSGSFKSLHLFMGLKKYARAVRLNSDIPSKVLVQVKDHQGKSVNYELLSLPFYLISELHRLLS